MTRANPIGQRERDLQGQILDLAAWHGWRAYHTHDSRRSQAGFPDLILIRGRRLLAVELKSPTGRVTTEQAEWLGAFAQLAELPVHPKGVIIEAYLWRPSDWPTIQRVLA